MVMIRDAQFFKRLILCLLLPYSICVLFHGRLGNTQQETLWKQLQAGPEVQVCYDGGTKTMPMELWIKGVLGCYLYYFSERGNSRITGNGKMLQDSISENQVERLDTKDLYYLTIQIRTNLYEEYVRWEKYGGTLSLLQQMYLSDEELEKLYGNRWEQVNSILSQTVFYTKGIIVTSEGDGIEVPLEDDYEVFKNDMLIQWEQRDYQFVNLW